MTLSQLQEQYDTAADRARTLVSRNADKGSIETALREAQALKARLDRVKGDASITAELDRITGGMRMRPSSGGGGGSMGDQIVNHPAFQELIKSGGHRSTNAWTSSAMELHAATLTEDAASGGDLVVADVQPGILPLPTRPLTLANLIAPGTTDSNLITYMKETTFTNAADTVEEGGEKQESTLIFDAVSDPVRKIAHWLPVTEEILEDVPAMRSYIDARLRRGVELALDDQLLNGSTTPPDIVGFLERTGLATSIARVAEVNADTVLTQILAIWTATNIQPDGIVMNPANWKTILLTKDTTGQYYGGGPFASPQRPTLWGLPVALTTAIVANTALDWRVSVVLAVVPQGKFASRN